jgi:hypothetical protein
MEVMMNSRVLVVISVDFGLSYFLPAFASVTVKGGKHRTMDKDP